MPENKIPLSRSILWILVSTLLISGSAFMCWLYYLQAREKKFNDDQYRIVALIQRNHQQDELKTAYLAQLLGLSIDRPINLYRFDEKKGATLLLQCPLIKKVVIKKIPPGTLFVDYQMRKPCAMLGDFSNTAIDEEGRLFPFHPFFTPKRLPAIYLGLYSHPVENGLLNFAKPFGLYDRKIESLLSHGPLANIKREVLDRHNGIETLEERVKKEVLNWERSLADFSSLQLAFRILKQLELPQMESFLLKEVDVSHAFADSFGQRQIVLILEEKENRLKTPLIYLRLNPDHIEQNLANFQVLSESWIKGDGLKKNADLFKSIQVDRFLVFDFRIPHLAFIKSGS